MAEIFSEKLINKGRGIGHEQNGRAVLVKKSASGEKLAVEITKNKKTFAEGAMKSIDTPSPIRVKPRCPYFDQCGGCDYQHLSYDDQLKAKLEIFTEMLSRQGIEAEPKPIIAASENQYRYRNNNRSFAVDHASACSRGLHHHADNSLFEVGECLLISEKANEVLGKLTKYLNHSVSFSCHSNRSGGIFQLPDGHCRKERSLHAAADGLSRDNMAKKNTSLIDSLIQLRIRESAATGEIMVELITSDDNLPDKPGLIELFKSIPKIKSVYHTIIRKQHDIPKRRLLYGSLFITDKIGNFTFNISATSFFRINTLGAKMLYDTVKQYAEVTPADTVLDLYCGIGTIGIYLSRMAKKVVGVESVREAVADANGNAKLNHASNAEFIRANVEEFLASRSTVCGPPSAIIFDPPRAGLSLKVIEILSTVYNLPSTKIIYVSCNPATFARDVKEFEKRGIRLVKVQPIDLFPQTQHIECVGLLVKR